MQTLAFILSILSTVSMITASLIKGKRIKLILFFVFLGNVLAATSYLLDGKGLNGAAACYLGGFMAIINYFFDSKGIKVPNWLLAIYAVCMISVNLWVAGGINPLVLIVIAATMIFVLCIGQTNGAKYRFWTLINILLWCVYDIAAQAYPPMITHVSVLLFTLAGMFIYDRKKTVQ